MTSVIIPTLNEELSLPSTIVAVRKSRVHHEIIVVDGGSTDATVRVAEDMEVTVHHSDQRRRAAQMNLGACQARGDSLLFLHADTLLPAEGLARIDNALSDAK